MRVLFVNRMACLERGGGETFDLEISRCLKGMGVEVEYLSSRPLLGAVPSPLEGATTLRGPWLKRFPWDKVKGGWRVKEAEFGWFVRRAARWIAKREGRWDVIQICELPKLVTRLKAMGVKTPLVMRLTAPNYYDPTGGVEAADALIASGTSIERMRAAGLTRVVDVPNAVDPEKWRPQGRGWRAEAGIGEGDFTAIYVARFQGFKNHAMLLEAWAKFRAGRTGKDWLLLAGSGPLRARCEAQAKSLGVEGSVRFLGEVGYGELPRVCSAADAAVVASDYESFCFAAVEAMAVELPVLTTDCGWVPKLVADGAGEVVPARDAEAFAAGLRRFAGDAELRRRLGTRGRELVLARHTWGASAEKLLAVYAGVTGH